LTDRLEPPSGALRHHGDLDALPGLVDLAVNVRAGTPPAWLRDRLQAVDLAAYPQQDAAVKAVAARHGRSPEEVLLIAGAAEAFVLIARGLQARRPVVIHPQFTEPEIALRHAGIAVRRIVLPAPFLLDPAAVPDDADLVVLGNPTNPTSVLHPQSAVRALRRPGRLVVVDEAFADCVPGEPESSAADPDVLVVRSLTKTWGLAGVRAGYLLGPAEVVDRLRRAQPHWPLNALAVEACLACSQPAAVAEAQAWAERLQLTRDDLAAQLTALPDVTVVPEARASFLLVRTPLTEPWLPLRERGFAVRRGDTFPGLDPHWFRVAVRDAATSAEFVPALEEALR
jgi:histidinol-phosphate aminotransferase